MTTKDELRRDLRRRRAALQPAERATETAATATAAAVLARLRPDLALYLAAGSELDLGPLWNACWARGVAPWAPRVVGDALAWARIRGPQDLAPGHRGLREPAPDLPCGPLPPACLVLVPGVGFGPAGARLGQGGGFYDRTLAALDPRSLAIGIGFSCQWSTGIPLEPHDRPLDAALIGGRLHPGTGRPRQVG